jgi:hypothetical protein
MRQLTRLNDDEKRRRFNMSRDRLGAVQDPDAQGMAEILDRVATRGQIDWIEAEISVWKLFRQVRDPVGEIVYALLPFLSAASGYGGTRSRA